MILETTPPPAELSKVVFGGVDPVTRVDLAVAVIALVE
jgi:hypothetical protein